MIPSEMKNLRNNMFEAQDIHKNTKISNSHLYRDVAQVNKYISQNKQFFKRKTTRPSKTRKFKRTRANRGLESVRDGNY